MLRKAHEMDLLTTPYAFTTEEAREMTEAGADVIVAHMGLTTKGAIGASTALTLEECPAKVQAICDEAKSIRSDVIVLCHGGPISMPEDAEYVIQNTNRVDGFYGASSVERLPSEIAITEQMEKFKAIRFE